MKESYYIKKYMIRCAAVIFGFAFFLFLIFFITALFYDVLEDDILIAFRIFGFAAVGFAFSLLPMIRFHHMIRMQESMFQIRFQSDSAKPIHRYSLIYLSDDWLLVAGRYAFYRDFIRNDRIKIQVRNTSRGNNYIVKIEGINERSYRFFADSSSSAKQIQAWSKAVSDDGERL